MIVKHIISKCSRKSKAIALHLTVVGVLLGCTGQKLTAEEHIANGNYNKAAEILEKQYAETKKKEDKLEIASTLGTTYAKLGDFKKAEKWYGRVVMQDSGKEEVMYGYAMALKMMEKPAEAIEQLRAYQKKFGAGSKDIVKEISMLVQYQSQLTDDCRMFEVEKFRRLNSEENDFAAVWGAEGLYFLRNGNELAADKTVESKAATMTGDVCLLAKDKKSKSGQWEKELQVQPKWMEKLGLGGNISSLSFTRDSNTMYLTAGQDVDNPHSGKVIKKASRVAGEWQQAEVLDICKDTLVQFLQVAVSPDGLQLVMSIVGKGGYSKADLYQSSFDVSTQTWTPVTSLGARINTSGEEQFPTWGNDSTLYYSSDGKDGYGGLDLYKVQWQSKVWGAPEHIRAPVNGPRDDFGVILNPEGTTGYFTSNRKGSKGYDIYKFEERVPEYYVTGRAYLVNDWDRSPDTVLIQNALFFVRGAQSMTDSGSVTFETDMSGSFKFRIGRGASFSLADINRDFHYLHGYSEKKHRVSSANWTCARDTSVDLYYYTIICRWLPVGIYDKGSVIPNAEFIRELDYLAIDLKKYEYMVVEVGSHTDCKEALEFDKLLSLRRSEYCVNYLVNKGIARERLVAVGYGASGSINECDCTPAKKYEYSEKEDGTNCTEEGYRRNRRTTFALLRKTYNPLTKKVEEVKVEE